jgi:3-oxoacyl-[acyl-carrier protein] reductase
MAGPVDNGVRGLGLKGRVVIVTGGARGIGRAYCQGLRAHGASVVVADIDGEGAASVAADLGDGALGVSVDITSEAQVKAMVAMASDSFGRIDGLVNNAGLINTLPRRPWHQIPVDEWDRVMAVNLRGTFLSCLAVHPVMAGQRYGKIVNISSSRVWNGAPGRLHYTASKAGIIGFTRSLAREVGGDGIRVNAVSPGSTLTGPESGDQRRTPAEIEVLNAQRSIKRTEVPEDLVGTVLYLLSPLSDFVTGQTINVDGGESMH